MLGPYVVLSERLGVFLSHIAEGNPRALRLTYYGRLADSNTQILRNAGVAGVLRRSSEYRPNVVNAMQVAGERGLRVVEQRETGPGQIDSIHMELDTDKGVFPVVGAVVLDRPRLLQVEGIACEVTLDGNLMYSKNQDVPGVIGFLGTVLGRNGINIANFALGRQNGNADNKRTEPSTAVSIVQTDGPVPESVISQLYENKAVKFVRPVTFA
jgi:D-3-phosphoglycerate dehydrogenase